MKKFLALILAILMVASVAVICASAAPEDTITINFDANGARGSIDSISKKEKDINADDRLPAASSKLTKLVGTFLYWEVTATKDNVEYTFQVDDEMVIKGKDGLLELKQTIESTNDKGKPKEVKITDGNKVGDKITLNLKAVWSSYTYTVKYDAGYNYGDVMWGLGTMADQTYTYGQIQKLTANNYAKYGYVFDGWKIQGIPFVTLEDKELFCPTLLSPHQEAEITLVAQWAPVKYAIVFDANSGEGEMDTVFAKYNSEVTLPEVEFSKVGYNFTGWKYDLKFKAFGYGPEVVLNKDAEDGATLINLTYIDKDTVTFVAQWAPIEYTVSFDANGGEGEIDTVDAIYDEVVDFENVFTKANYHQLGWLDEDGNFYAIDEDLINLTVEDGAEVVLSAVWEGDARTVTYTDGVADKEIFADQVYDTNYDAETPAFVGTPKRDGYTFKGWDKEVAKTVTDSVVYTAVWVENPKTADTTSVILFATLALVSVMGAGYAVVRKNLSK